MFSKTCHTDDEKWNDYVLATIAFLNKDEASFRKYTGSENYNDETLARLKANWDKPYKDAY